MDEEALEKYLKAGEIASSVRRDVVKKVKPGVKILDLCKYIEREIVMLGGKPAFPANISINEEAAHYTAKLRDSKTVPYPSIVKVDIGVHVDGYIADTAVTLVFSDNSRMYDLAQAAEEALEASLKVLRAGVKLRKIGEVVEKTIKKFGYNPVRNLTGHSLEKYSLHAGISIPNYNSLTTLGRIEAGRVYAIEPFATMGSGYVVEGRETTIYSVNKPGRAKLELEKRIVSYVIEKYRSLPFSERWLEGLVGWKALRSALENMVSRGVLRGYPVLIDSDKCLVSQSEHTVVVLDREVIVTTI